MFGFSLLEKIVMLLALFCGCNIALAFSAGTTIAFTANPLYYPYNGGQITNLNVVLTETGSTYIGTVYLYLSFVGQTQSFQNQSLGQITLSPQYPSAPMYYGYLGNPALAGTYTFSAIAQDRNGHNIPINPISIEVWKPIIQLNGNDITGQQTPTCVGLQISLSGSTFPAGIPIASQTWSLSGSTIGSYTQTNNTATSTDVILTNPAISFYWYDGGDPNDQNPNTSTANTVTYSPVVGGNTLNAVTTYNVYKPTATINSNMGTVNFTTGGCNGTPGFFLSGLFDALDGLNDLGITFTCNNYQQPTQYQGGSIQWAQVMFYFNYEKEDTHNNWSQESNPYEACDACPYPPLPGGNPLLTSDTPGIPFDGTSVSYYMTVEPEMLFEYEPAGSTFWVPLRGVEWYANGECVLQGGAWTMSIGSNTSNQEVDAGQYVLPEWTINDSTVLAAGWKPGYAP